MTGPRPDCERFADDLVALALGTIDGRARASAIAHVEKCPLCMAELDALSGPRTACWSSCPKRSHRSASRSASCANPRGVAHPARGRRCRTAVLVAAAALVAGVVGFLAGHGLGSLAARPDRDRGHGGAAVDRVPSVNCVRPGAGPAARREGRGPRHERPRDPAV